MTFHVSGGSHRRAVHPNVMARVCLPRMGHRFEKLFRVFSCVGFLASAVSEYGFDVDFPLTPHVWLVIAICAVVVATAHAALPKASGLTGILSQSESASFLSNVNPGGPTAPVRDCRATAPVAIGPEATISASGALALQILVCVTASDGIPAIVFLSPAATRGPPWSNNRIDPALCEQRAGLGRSARHCYTASLPSEIHPSSSRSNEIITISPGSMVLARGGLSPEEKTT